ncbi:polysaccharide deacetylase family protein [Variovorax ginsengisoli]|uniref:Peptidoglycan/xylan/chitin deacetylase (PgdA/CDA1 family) n=1 Tax=Variovorax ginsengisoli TaxID=363844 RepID=A0ABT9SCK4_9BURK|nr:polysaccharide deacetylase family protein [Variovorax ginsengisoli]MDP9902070.1 peptidoglycan/xylan/chitin deacetylase (PgdA/CDA1 family) [Variovorax ginsengisoli]
MALIALKVDVDTLRGTRDGVPALAAFLRGAGAGASFLFSLGPDHTGRAVLRVLRPGFLSKVSRTSVVEHYGVRTLLYGTLLPGPDIGRIAATTLRDVEAAGFEVGVHCWDHVRWQDQLLAHDAPWALREMRRATDRYATLFGTPARLHGAAGWQFNEAAAQAQAELGITLASDTRGSHPFQPVFGGRVTGPPQLPTTLPTLDELIGLDGMTLDDVVAHVLSLTVDRTRDQVFTLHAELEGMKLLPVLRRLVDGWRAQGHDLVSLGALRAHHSDRAWPLHEVHLGSVPGRSGLLAVQGPRVA